MNEYSTIPYTRLDIAYVADSDDTNHAASRTDATPIPVFADSDDGTDAWSIENARPSNEDG
jgi:hypothetical protein